jgi:septal ring factor EnvC (AmiA/AmiB activator)
MGGSSMPEQTLSDRLEELEKAVRRAAEVIAMLRRERDQLQARFGAGESDRAELSRLRQERKDVLSQVNAMLKEMEKLQL